MSEQDYEAFEGLEQSYIEMEKEFYKAAPICHFTKMSYEYTEDYFGDDLIYWWECKHCGHTKDIK